MERMDGARIRVVLVEDHAMFRAGLAALLAAEPDIDVVGAYASGEEAIRRVEDDRPDIVLLDVRLPGLDGTATLGQLRHRRTNQRVIMLTAQEGDETVYRALKAGATGYVLKKQPIEELLAAIRRGLTGAPAMAAEVSERVTRRLGGPEISARELEILKLVARGRGNKDIGEELGISLNTVRNHVAEIMGKLDAEDRTHAVTIAIQRGILDL